MDCIESHAQPTRQFHSVVIRPEVHEKEPRLVVEHVVVERHDLDPVVLKGLQQQGSTSFAVATKSPLMAALPSR